MVSTGASLGGYPLVNTESVGWKIIRGTAPYQRVFELHPDNAKALLEATKPSGTNSSGTQEKPKEVSLIIEAVGHPQLKIDGLTVLHEVPPSLPYLKAVLVTDRRFYWGQRFMSRTYNLRRKSGDKRIVGTVGGQNTLNLNLLRTAPQDDVVFAPFSLFGGVKQWNAEMVLTDVFNELMPNEYTLSNVALDGSPALIDGIELDGTADTCVSQLLSLCGNLEVYIDVNGKATIVSSYDGGEVLEIGASTSPIFGMPILEVVSLARRRPSAIDVLFTREDEIRFDFNDPDTSTQDANNPPRQLENVLQLPDPELRIGNKDFGQGSWVPINQALLNAWNTDLPPSVVSVGAAGGLVSLGNFTFDFLRKSWANGFMLWRMAGQPLEDPIWARRVDALMAHYRQTFRVPYRWMSAFRYIKPVRHAIIDEENLTYGPADIFGQWAKFITMRAVAKQNGDLTWLHYNHDEYATNLTSENNSKTGRAKGRPSPARMIMRDEEQGIFTVQYGDVFGDADVIWPSMAEMNSELIAINNAAPLASMDPRYAVGMIKQHTQLKSAHNMAAIFTCCPASPNSNQRFFRYRIDAKDVLKLLPPKAVDGLKESLGPVMQIRVGPGTLTAKRAWSDFDAQSVTNSILFGGGDNLPKETLINEPEIKAVAQAVAATLYLGFVDRFEGTLATSIDPARKPKGRISSVSHDLMPDGSATTMMSLPPDLKPVDFWQLVPESIRRILLRQVKP